jgi:hypothetical protein
VRRRKTIRQPVALKVVETEGKVDGYGYLIFRERPLKEDEDTSEMVYERGKLFTSKARTLISQYNMRVSRSPTWRNDPSANWRRR